VKVTQVYRNEGETPIEARYVFPASSRAAVYALRLRVGDRAVDAQIREKQQARAEYAQARREGKSAALLEQQRPNVFTMAIANVMPGDEIAVDLRYTETVVPTEGTYRFVFPTVVGPRYNGGAGGSAEGGAVAPTESHKREAWIAQPVTRAGVAARHSVALQARVVAPLPVASVSSPTHTLAVSGVGTHEAQLSLDASSAHANRDVVIEYRLAGASIGAGMLVQRGAGPDDENFFLLMAQPPARVTSADVMPREYVFIVDVSGSMHGFPLDTAKTLLRDLVGRLRPSDTFNVIPFAGGQSLLHPQSLPASEENIARAIRFINGQNGGGGTELLPALRRALAMPSDLGRARTFVVITDGYVTIEKEAFDLVREKLGSANLFAFGIGSSVNRFLIEGLARAGKGEPFFVLKPETAAEQARQFRSYIEQPVLTRIRVKFNDAPGGFAAYDLDNRHLPDLFAQRPIVLMGKFRGELNGAIEIEGLSAGGAVRLPIDVAQAVQAGGGGQTQGLKYLWARSRIAELGDYTRVGGGDDAVRQITDLGLKYNLLTDYTSFIAVDKVIRNPGGASRSVDQPSPLPEGVSELAVGAAPATPEPEFALLAALAGGLTWWMRRRGLRTRRADGMRAETGRE
jgi:Ca-activated chloride channel family protein